MRLKCILGYDGKNCEININECHNSPCIHGECIDGTGYFECKCETGWTGQYCDTEKNECDPDPCHNGGICQDLIGGYECINCPEGTSKPNCEDNVDECKVNNVKCLNGGVPVDGVGKCSCQCPAGFEGAQCQINIDDCANNPCFNHGKCIDLVNDFKCECDLTKTFGDRCYSIETPCKPNPCSNEGQCRRGAHGHGFECECAKGWIGPHCQESACHATVCENGGRAMPQVRPYYNSSCRCECTEGFTGDHCEQSVVCNSSNPCKHGRCSSPDGRNIECTCDDGYIGEHCDKEVNPCKSDLCENGGKCYKDANNEAKCLCVDGWTGPRCQEDIDECDKNGPYGPYGPCQNGGECINKKGGYQCECKPGFKGEYCNDDINDCALNPCRNGGDCINNRGQGYRCKCASGFYGSKCEKEKNECVGNPCQHGGTCIDAFESFKCECPPGYRGSKCEDRINSCSSTTCLNGGTCSERHDGFSCSCPVGFNGTHCENRLNRVFDACQSKPCQNGGTCINQVGKQFQCICPPGFSGETCSITSQSCIDVASERRLSLSQICKNRGKCVDTNDNSHKCECQDGYEGDYCDREIDKCENFHCENNGVCTTRNGYPQCTCLPSWSGEHCERRRYFCEKNPCLNYGQCFEMPYDEKHGFACSCLPGTEGRLCELNRDNCMDPLPGGADHCNGHGKCYDGIRREDLNSYKCDCDQGYEGPRCETKTDYCERSSCERYGTLSCTPEVGSFECECKPGFSGPTCSQWSEPEDPCRDDNPCQNGATCSYQMFTSIDAKKCTCPVTDITAFHGDRCEEQYPVNMFGQICYNSIGLINGKCDCQAEWKGAQCNELKEIKEKVCEVSICQDLANNGKCDQMCNHIDCDFDGGDCSLGETNPWADCPAEFECHLLYNDGQCDSHCNTEECLFDGFDCGVEEGGETCPFENYCATHFGDDYCDESCNIAACGFDGGDCEERSEPTSTFEIEVDVDNLSRNITFNHNSVSFEHHITRMLSIILRTKVFIVSVDHTAEVPTLSRKRRAAALSNTKLTMGINSASCQSGYCFNNAKYAARYLGSQAIGSNSNTPYFNIQTAAPLQADYQPEEGQLPMYVVMGACSIILLSTVILVVAKRKRERATLWRGIPIPEPQRKRPRGDIVKSNYPQDYGISGYNSQMGLWSPTQQGLPAGDNAKWDPTEQPLLDQQFNTNVEQAGPDNTNAIHVIGKEGTRMDKTGETGEENTVRLLLENGCDLNLQTTTYEETPLHLAAKFARADAAKQILQCGANPNVRDSKGRTPLHTAIASDSYGVFTIIANHNRCDLEAKSEDGSTALILAARLEMNKCVNDLIQHHVDVNAADLNGKTALHWACEVNNQRATDQLLKHGANKDSQNEREETPLFLAAKEGSYDCVELLLSHFANRELSDFMDRLPRDIASQKMHRDIVDLLERSTNHMGANHYEQTFAMNQYKNKIPTKKRPRVSAPHAGAGCSRAQSVTKRAKRASVGHFGKSSQNLTTLPGGFGSTTLSPPQDHHYMQHPGLGAHFHTLGHPGMNRALSMAAGLNPGAYGSAPTTPARGQPQFYPGGDFNQSLPHGGYTYQHVHEYMRSPISHAPQRNIYEYHRFSMTNNYPL